MSRKLTVHMNDYSLSIEMDNDGARDLSVSGPDQEICHLIGQRFLSLVQTERGKRLIAKCTREGTSADQRYADHELLTALDVPSSSDFERKAELRPSVPVTNPPV